MTSTPEYPEESSSTFEKRLSTLEDVLRLDERLKLLETTLSSKSIVNNVVPWWKNGKIVVVLGAFLSAILPLVTAVNGIVQNKRDSQRQLIEQQDKIRQTYLDRVLKPDLTEAEQQRIFNLLAKLTADPELSGWAREELAHATQKIEDLKKEKSALEEYTKSIESQLNAEKQKSAVVSSRTREYTSTIQRLTKEQNQTQQKVASLQRRIGESDSKVAGNKISCTSPDGSTSASIFCLGGGICFAENNGNAFAECTEGNKPEKLK